MTAPSSGGMKEAKGSLDVMLHPLVIINISDHYTRAKVEEGPTARVYGALLGFQAGRRVDIENSFEFVVSRDEAGEWRIDVDMVKTRLGLYKRGFEAIDIVGWYSTGKDVHEHDLSLHQQMEQFNENPFYLLLDPQPLPGAKELPIHLLETNVKTVAGSNTVLTEFERVPYHIDSNDAERIAVDHVSRVSGSGKSQLNSHLVNMHSSIKMLTERIGFIATYLEAVKAGTLPLDHTILRSVGALMQQLPAIDSQRFQGDFLEEFNDALLVTYLSTLTKTSAALAQLTDKFNIAFDRSSARRRGF
jgi:COP9 signalosome complex subunit 6